MKRATANRYSARPKGGVIKTQLRQVCRSLTVDNHIAGAGTCVIHLLRNLGGLLAISAMTQLMHLGWKSVSGWGGFIISLVYVIAGLFFAEYTCRRKQLNLPPAIMASFVVALTPLVVFGLQTALGYWKENASYLDSHAFMEGRFLLMALTTAVAGIVLFNRYRFPLPVMLPVLLFWYLCVDLSSFLLGDADPDWILNRQFFVWFGMLTTLASLWEDIRLQREKTVVFWLSTLAAGTLWWKLSGTRFDGALSQFISLCCNLAMMVAGALFSRWFFTLLGGFGIAGYLGYMAHGVLGGSIMFPVVLAAIGIATFYLWGTAHSRVRRQK